MAAPIRCYGLDVPTDRALVLRVVVPLLALVIAPGAVAQSTFSPQADYQVRYEHTGGLPAGRADLERGRGRARLGFVFENDAGWTVGVSAEAAAGTDSNRDNVANLDNERSDDFNLDRLFLGYRLGEQLTLGVGQNNLPLTLTPMVWDNDLRPQGAFLAGRHPMADFDAFKWRAGWFRTNHLYGDNSRLAAAQAAYTWQEGAPLEAEVALAYLHFDRLDQLIPGGLGRTNRRVGAQFVSDYRLVDVQFAVKHTLGSESLTWRLNGVRNTGADDLRDGARFSVVWGDAQDGGLELGLAAQRIGRDAVLAAVSDDEWWFHSFARGVMPWFAYGFHNLAVVRVAGFRERRDGLNETTNRVFVELHGQY